MGWQTAVTASAAATPPARTTSCACTWQTRSTSYSGRVTTTLSCFPWLFNKTLSREIRFFVEGKLPLKALDFGRRSSLGWECMKERSQMRAFGPTSKSILIIATDPDPTWCSPENLRPSSPRHFSTKSSSFSRERTASNTTQSRRPLIRGDSLKLWHFH